MRNVCFYIVFLLIGFSSFGQGVDVIFLLDNSLVLDGYPVHSVPVNPVNNRYRKMHNSVNAIMDYLLECNTFNRVTTVQHCDGHDYGTLTTVDSDFVHDTIAFTRDWDVNADKLEESLTFVSDRLSGIPDSSPLGSGKLLHKAVANKLVVVIFNAYSKYAQMRTDGSDGFLPFNNFKSDHDASIIYIHINTNSADIRSAAAISSVGGSYTGPVESNLNDPDGSGITPRYYWNTNDYELSASEIAIIGQQICALAPACLSDITLISPTNDVVALAQDLRQAQNTITASNVVNNGAVGIYHGGTDVLLKSGFHSANGSIFRGYIEGCSDQYVGLSATAEDESTRKADSETVTEESTKDLFTLYPNPATDRTTVISDKIMTNITVTGLDGYTLFKSSIKGNSFDLNISDYPKGFYIITVTTESGEMEVKKLIKK